MLLSFLSFSAVSWRLRKERRYEILSLAMPSFGHSMNCWVGFSDSW